MKKFLRLLFSLLVFWFSLHCTWVVVDGLYDALGPADCILIAGNTVNPDGNPSDRLRARLEAGLRLYRAGLAPNIMVSGGLGAEGHYEGTAMSRYLLGQGVPAEAIIVDDAGSSTWATVENFADAAERRGFQSVILVSQFYHLTRFKLLLRQTGDYQVYQAHARYFELRDIYSLLREFPAYYRYVLASPRPGYGPR
ncbi:YdcF family protein [Hymenobacter sp. B81]|uniref:YdcF family protein n=1 Tax=Hymenobacter sp. B81 TaxID=3344878 RepID=UPI0037DCAA69